mmetsp:Transcript_29697/g.59607  ORF Transcript_29697/g.59607 Transcript_29697/m.59607 type:complete len:110 (+) Transcript_29697:245-574(+)
MVLLVKHQFANADLQVQGAVTCSPTSQLGWEQSFSPALVPQLSRQNSPREFVRDALLHSKVRPRQFHVQIAALRTIAACHVLQTTLPPTLSYVVLLPHSQKLALSCLST